MKEKVCKICGQKFIPTSGRQQCCNKPIKRRCIVCGIEFDSICNAYPVLTCDSAECKHRAKFEHINNSLPERVCKQCGQLFTPKTAKQVYCNQVKTKTCVNCNKEFTYQCCEFTPETCSSSCQSSVVKMRRRASVSAEERVCKFCGTTFRPTEVRQAYCSNKHFKNCVICGKQFEIDVSKDVTVQTCSIECKTKLASQHHDYKKGHQTQQKTLLEKYGVNNAALIPGAQDKVKQTGLEKYGSEWYTQTQEYKERVRLTSLKHYSVEHHLQSKEIIEKRIKTTQKKYGVSNVFQSAEIKQKSMQTNIEKFGVPYVSQCAEVKQKATRNSKNSKLEQRISALLDNYNIKYLRHFFLSEKRLSHEFDFFLPDCRLLIDADGIYFHGYLDDPDGVRVREDYDEVRLALVPEDCRFTVLIEGDEDRQLKEIVNLIEQTTGSLSELDSQLFEWCRSIDFPWPQYSEERMFKDWSHLIRYSNMTYVPQCRLGQSLIKHFHKSIFHARVGSALSPFEAWHDDNALKQVIRNRLIYKNDVQPAKILAGFNLSKICPSVSTFNPVLTKYLVKKYLDEFSEIFDPFSGFSGRLLGVAACEKRYKGQDLNGNAVSESNDIITFLKLDASKYSVVKKDVLESQGEFECLLSCPPYGKKEIYSEETEFKSCDEWIQECLDRFDCKRYVFVVDETKKFESFVKEEIRSDSHLTHAVERVVVIDK